MAGLVRAILLTNPEEERLARQVEIVNQLLAALGTAAEASVVRQELVAPAQRLTAMFEPSAFREGPPQEPDIPISQSDLLVNATGEPRIGPVLQSEVESADRIDLLIAFIRWSGLRLIEPKLRAFLESGAADARHHDDLNRVDGAARDRAARRNRRAGEGLISDRQHANACLRRCLDSELPS